MDKQVLEQKAQTEIYLKVCRAKKIIRKKLVECILENPACNYLLFFGNGKFWKHPLSFEIARRTRENN